MTTAEFPKWAPHDVIAQWREEKRDADQGYKRTWIATGNAHRVAEYRKRAFGIPDLLQRILTDPCMLAVWTRIESAGNYRGMPHTTLFVASVIHGWMGPWGEARWTQSERRRWSREVAGLAGRLAAKLEGTNADRRFLSTALHRFEPNDLSELLRTLGRYAEKFLARPAGVRSTPRAYFVRTLTEYCREGLGVPERALVTATAAVALGDDTITERQVYRLTPDAKPRKANKKRHF